MRRFESQFDFGEKVHIDGDRDLKLIVTGFNFQPNGTLIEVSWVCNGDLKTGWVWERRLTKVKQ